MQTAKLIYGNCCVLSPSNILMFRCNNKKVRWYLNKGLAIIVNNDPLTIKLNFQPNGLGNYGSDYGLSEMKNICVNCGTDSNLTRHHIVPIGYRRYFPLEIKSHNFHDVLPMCNICHESYERKADELKRTLSEEYNAPINGEVINNGMYKYNKMASTLLAGNISNRAAKNIKRKIKEKFGIKRLTRNRIIRISNSKSVSIRKTHGEIVISKISDINLFIKMWRNHFIENNQCSYIPKNWNVDYIK